MPSSFLYQRSIDLLESLAPDVFLAAHGGFFDLRGKAERMRKGAAPNPFVGGDEYAKWLARMKNAFRDQLARDRAAK